VFEAKATRGWGGDECHSVDMCIVLDQSGDQPEFKGDGQMSDLL
jgi:hypothetical protein